MSDRSAADFEAALRLARRIAVLPAPGMRRATLAEALRADPPTTVVAVLHALVVASRRSTSHLGGPPFSEALEALATTLGDEAALGYDLRAALYLAAKEAALEPIARLFFAARPGEVTTDDHLTERPVEPQVVSGLGPRTGRPLTLGERKSLARGSRRELLTHLLRDPDAPVMRVLLGNPRLTERDVVAVAARRPSSGELLRAVFDSRWLPRYAVKRALVMNPWTPSDLAVRLVATLTEPDLRAIAADANLSPPLRAQAKALLDAR